VELSRAELPNRSFLAELMNAEVDTQVRKILALGVNRHSGFGPVPLRDGVINPRVSPGSLEGRGRQPLGESARAYFCLVVSISAFLTLVVPML
jgi:hypothetical protein